MAFQSATRDPVCLIENQSGVGLIVNEEALQILNDLPQPLVVVAIVGKYRTGKSYLMNNLAGSKSGFALGATIQSMTKGIWMWCVPHSTKPDHSLVLLDTEGLGDVEKGDNENDAWIFCLAVLLSSNLVFNSVGTIDQQAMDQLHYVTELTRRIRLKSSNNQDENDSAEYKRVFPSFTWCVRDFSLHLELDGREITEDEYLKHSLRLKPGLSDKIKEYNLPRECILEYFHSHKCFVFDRPTSTENLHRLEDLQDRDLNEEFVRQTGRFCSYIFQDGRIKTLAGGQEISGRLLGQLAVTYVKAIQSNCVPCLESAVVILAKTENEEAIKDAVSRYDAEMSAHERDFPTETQDELLIMHLDSEEKAIKAFLSRSFQDKDQEFQHQLKTIMGEKFKIFSNSNDMISADVCKSWLFQLGETLEHKIERGEYMKPGGHKEFLKDKMHIVEFYNEIPRKGVKTLEVLRDFISQNRDIEAAIMRADETLTENLKVLREKEAEADAAERETEILRMEAKHQENIRHVEQRRYEQHTEMLLKKMEEDKAQLRRENQWLEDQKKREIETYRENQENHAKINQLQRDVEKLQAKNEEKEDGFCVIA